MSDEDEDQIMCTPPDVRETADKASLDLLPQKSKEIYERAYKKLEDYRQEKNIGSFSENVMLAYFSDLSENMKSSSLWSQYSMVRAMVNIKHNVDISKYMKLRAFLKSKHHGYLAKKSKILSQQDFQKFLEDAPDNKYLMYKVAFIFGIAGACCREELAHMKVDDIADLGSALLIKIPDNKTNKPRSFTVTGNYLEYYRKYALLRPKEMNDRRFFSSYRNGKCAKQVVGIHKFGSIPREIATYLNLPNAKEYTGHCFRRTSATFLVDAGGDITSLKRHGGWRSSNIAEGYIDDSMNNKLDVAKKILNNTEIAPEPSSCSLTMNETINGDKETSIRERISEVENITNSTVGINSLNNPIIFQNCTNCTFNIGNSHD